jgi:hypothetical protein
MADSQLGIVLRPRNFDDVIGQDDIIRTMRAKLDKGEVPRAIMFVGPPGTGKTTLAKIIARAAQGWDFPADEEPELIEINAADFRKIDDMRDLMQGIDTYPLVGKVRVIILDEAHQLTKDSQNLLLKPFEKEVSPILWIICTTETAKILPALVSRCQVFTVARLNKKSTHLLLERAATYLGHGDYSNFEAVAIREHLDQPRPLLNAFENYHNGMTAEDAINSQLQNFTSNHFEIAKAVVYGSWDHDGTVWGKPSRSVKALLAEMELTFKKTKDDEPGDGTEEDVVSKEDAVGRPEAARALRAIVAALLKGRILKEGSMAAAEAVHIISHCAPPSAFDTGLEYPATVGGLLRVNKKMTGK